jgi:hypothetical protein
MTKRRFWRPSGGGYNCFYAVFEPAGDRKNMMYHKSNTGAEREAFIREQSELIRKFPTEEEYLAFYKMVLTLTS